MLDDAREEGKVRGNRGGGGRRGGHDVGGEQDARELLGYNSVHIRKSHFLYVQQLGAYCVKGVVFHYDDPI